MSLNAQGVDAILDDRDERAGVKFKDADLIGYPVRVVVGPKTLQRGAMEVKVRYTGEMCDLPLDPGLRVRFEGYPFQDVVS